MKDDKGVDLIIGIGKPKGAMDMKKAKEMDDKDGTYDDGNEDMDVCFPVPKGLKVADGDIVKLETTYEIKDGDMYPTQVEGHDIEANEDKEESDEEDTKDGDGGDGVDPDDLSAQRDHFRNMAKAQDQQLGYGG